MLSWISAPAFPFGLCAGAEIGIKCSQLPTLLFPICAPHIMARDEILPGTPEQEHFQSVSGQRINTHPITRGNLGLPQRLCGHGCSAGVRNSERIKLFRESKPKFLIYLTQNHKSKSQFCPKFFL